MVCCGSLTVQSMETMKIIMTMGLPGSGKTTWARRYQTEHPGVARVNKDDLRAMLHDSKQSKGRENFVLTVRDFIVGQALAGGHDVIVDDTNFHPKHRARLEEIAAEHGAIVEIKDFTDVPLEECIARDLSRPRSVGERVIRSMHRQYLAPKITPHVFDPALPAAILCDVDGTLALFGDANPYDRDFSKDLVNKPVADLLLFYALFKQVIFLSGRKERYREQTVRWLAENGLPVDTLLMRRDGDDRKDAIIKEELYNEHIRGKYSVCMVIDDRLQVCRMWHRLGLPLFRVGDPDADF